MKKIFLSGNVFAFEICIYIVEGEFGLKTIDGREKP